MNALRLISIPEAAERYLGMSEWLAYELAKRGEFPGNAAHRYGRRWLVSVPQLLEALHGIPIPTEAPE